MAEPIAEPLAAIRAYGRTNALPLAVFRLLQRMLNVLSANFPCLSVRLAITNPINCKRFHQSQALLSCDAPLTQWPRVATGRQADAAGRLNSGSRGTCNGRVEDSRCKPFHHSERVGIYIVASREFRCFVSNQILLSRIKKASSSSFELSAFVFNSKELRRARLFKR